jgi:hypothetical protein
MAGDEGVARIEVRPAETPGTVDSGIALLNGMPGLTAAVWDTAQGSWVASVEDSALVDPRAIRDGLTEAGIPPATVLLHLEDARFFVENSAYWMRAPANGIKLAVLYSMRTRYLARFYGMSKYSWGAPMRATVEMRWGAMGDDGVAAPDSLELLLFELNRDKLGS